MAVRNEHREIVIVGGGIIGCTTAYYLTRHPAYEKQNHQITLLEATKIAGGASGKAGGLLGSWAYPSCLAQLSFDLHAQLAEEHRGDQRWGYRRLNCGSLDAKGRQLDPSEAENTEGLSEIGALHKRPKRGRNPPGLPSDLDWISPDASAEFDGIGDVSNTAQVHPYQFTVAMSQLAEERGVKIVLGSVIAIDEEDKAVRAVRYRDAATNTHSTISATDVLLTAGPWTSSILPKLPVTALRAHSVTIAPSGSISPYALFTEIKLPGLTWILNSGFGKTQKVKRAYKTVVSPEIYARPNNEAYACGEGDHLVPLPNTTADVQVDDGRCQDIIDYVSSISDELRDGQVTARQACYLPQGGPFIGPTGVEGLLVASGHTCWGIQNSAATGKLMSELVFDGQAKSANIKSLDPRRVM